MDNDEIVDETTAANDLLAAAVEKLRGYGIAAATERREVRLGRTAADAIVRLGYGGQEVQYAVELKLGLRPKALGAVIHQLERHGEQGLLLLGLGQLMEQGGDYAGASVFYREGLALASRQAGAPGLLHQNPHYLLHNNLGYCLNQSGQCVEAEEHCRAAIGIDPELHNAHKNLGVALEGQGRYAAAAEAFLRAAECCPGDPRALRHLEQLLAAHGGVAAEIPDLAARLDACRELVTAARRRLLARLSG